MSVPMNNTPGEKPEETIPTAEDFEWLRTIALEDNKSAARLIIRLEFLERQAKSLADHIRAINRWDNDPYDRGEGIESAIKAAVASLCSYSIPPTQPGDVAREAAIGLKTFLDMRHNVFVPREELEDFFKQAITRALTAAKAENEKVKRERDVLLKQKEQSTNFRNLHELHRENDSLRQQLAEAQNQLNQQNP